MKLRHRTVTPPQIRFGEEVAAIFSRLPATGPLFPYLRIVREADGATELKQRLYGATLLPFTADDQVLLSLCLGGSNFDFERGLQRGDSHGYFAAPAIAATAE